MSLLTTYNPKGFHKRKTVVERFESADEMVRVSRNRHITDSSFTDKRKSSNLRSNWDGVETFQEAEELLMYGYQPFVDKLEAKLSLTAHGMGSKRVVEHKVVGQTVSVPRYLAGIPSCMRYNTRKSVPNKVLNVYLDKTALQDKKPYQIEDACLKFVSAMIDIELQGYRINLYIAETHNDGSDCDMFTVKVKDASAPLDLKRMSFPLAHTAFFRVIGFDWYSRCPLATYCWGYGHNLGRDYTHEEITEAFEEMFREKCVVFELEDIIGKSEEAIKDVILNANKRLG